MKASLLLVMLVAVWLTAAPAAVAQEGMRAAVPPPPPPPSGARFERTAPPAWATGATAPRPAPVASPAAYDPAWTTPPDWASQGAGPAASAGGGGGGDDAAAIARAMADPLGTISALFTDNTILFGTGEDDVSYNFQLQPMYALNFERQGFSIVPRGVIPILGVPGLADLPPLEEQRSPADDTKWGLGDIVLQSFIAPKVSGDWKWGLGPQFSFPTATDSDLQGAGWGLGFSGVVTGPITDDLSFAMIIGNLWGLERDFNTLLLQPIFTYNIPSMPGSYIAYNNAITADWTNPSDNRWSVPLGLTFGALFRYVWPLSSGILGAPPITGDQVELLKSDNVVSDGAKTLADLGVTELETVEAIVPSYLYRFRPYGQYHQKSETA